MTGIVIVFDFDNTIIDCDSDNLVVDDLGATRRFDELLESLPWNSAMERLMMRELHSQGKSMEEILDSLKRAPLSPHTIAAIKSAYALGCDLRIISDANLFFIETILKHHCLHGYFSEINTNPGYVDKEGRLGISPYPDFTTSSHGCRLCPPNLCKGMIIERIRISAFVEGKKRFIYLGDGKGDYCPSLKLNEGDYVMPRNDCPLWELICDDPQALKAEIHGWSDAEELEIVLLRLINCSLSTDLNNAAQLLSADCMFQTVPLSSHEPLTEALHVPDH